MRRIASVTALAALLIAGAVALAHEGHEHIMGTVVKVEKARLELKDRDGKTAVVGLTPSTTFLKGKEPATAADVKPGVRVAIEATKGSAGLEAVEVKIGKTAP